MYSFIETYFPSLNANYSNDSFSIVFRARILIFSLTQLRAMRYSSIRYSNASTEMSVSSENSASSFATC
ncbi:hypothetical protein B4U80_06647 [Leptotrombidium deliense]|uniref:Uncharacterized protein n=1 Tax=Leptotrombidium deliense TaxID=299467 RepID=A0A443SAQ3_9ACAR|nr:hypothetical protein B4U80_06647 [Leptotrombidium deliense]